MSKKFSSFDQQQLIMENFRKFINEEYDDDDDDGMSLDDYYDQLEREDDEDYMRNQADYRGKDLSADFDFEKYAPKQMTYEEYEEKIDDFARRLHNSEKEGDKAFEREKSSVRTELGEILKSIKDKELYIDVVEHAKEWLGPYLNPEQK